MAHVMTTANTFTCSHTGTASLSGPSKLKVDGKPVLLSTGSWSVTACKPSKQGDVACTTISLSGGAAAKLKVSGTPVALETATATSNGTPSLVAMSGTESKLRAS